VSRIEESRIFADFARRPSQLTGPGLARIRGSQQREVLRPALHDHPADRRRNEVD
jgi:hypothetical protein